MPLSSLLLFKMQVLERGSQYKFLGVQFHENLRWAPHVEFLVSNIAKSVGVLNRYWTLLLKSLKRQSYYFKIHSRLHYCVLIWGVTLRSNLNSLYLMQKRSL